MADYSSVLPESRVNNVCVLNINSSLSQTYDMVIMLSLLKLFNKNKWLTVIEQRALEGNAAAQYKLGKLYNNGLSIKQDHQKAFEWISKAAHQGLSEAQHMLGFMYANGIGVEKDHLKAENWFKKGFNQ